ncbi:hypothetical protein N8I71_08740 [Roseibacterium sp. SDUM158016]|uniref:hypothetical protein n=1 Tax=Roseicyclus sediminis TaxID=2980997 RepID=UPI0021D2D6D1|nr:hypothetical protein [Roseibacterium sp. SDUM158016]MCU4652917.1 hypothetical protein [Roseibacterium sp. SDUM158016]
MTLLQLLPILLYCATIVTVFAATAGAGPGIPGLWRFPALLGAAFALVTAVTLVVEGPLQFWINHTTTWAGNQVWFDLLFATAIAFIMILPRARAVGMRPWPWAIATVSLACLALLPMLARLMWLEEHARTNAEPNAR